MTREQIEAWLTLEGHYLSCNSLFFYCIAYGREWTRYRSIKDHPSDTWDDHGIPGNYYDSGGQRIASWSEIPWPALKQLYYTLAEYKENPT